MSWFSGKAQKATKGELAPVDDNTIAGGRSITESTGIDIPGAGADRQRVDVQPGEYIFPFHTVMRLGGPSALDNVVAQTDSNSNAAKLGLNKPQSMAR